MTAADGRVTMTDPKSMQEFIDSGLLWAINRVLLHPRGFALALDVAAEGCTWQLWGDGDEPWQYAPMLDEKAKMEAFELLLASVTR